MVSLVSRAGLPAAVALGALAVAWALPVQSVGCGQNAHYAATGRSPRATRTSTGTRRRRATSCAVTVTPTPRRGRRSTSGRPPGTCCCARRTRCRRTRMPASPIPRRWSACRLARSGRSDSGRWCSPVWRSCCSSAGHRPAGAGTRHRGGGRARARHARPPVLDAALRARAGGHARVRVVRAALRRSRTAQSCRGGGLRGPRRLDRPAARRPGDPARALRRGLCTAPATARRVRRRRRGRPPPALCVRRLGIRLAVPQRLPGRRHRPRRRRRRAGARAQPVLHAHVAAPDDCPRPAAEPARPAGALAGPCRLRRPVSSCSGAAACARKPL